MGLFGKISVQKVLMKPHLAFAHNLWRSLILPGDLAIDATVGNGHDSVFLCELGAEVIGLDIQREALEKTRERMRDKPIQLLLKSHAEIASLELKGKAKLIVYNLGYLPGGNKEITTKLESTMASVEGALGLLARNGALSITCYPGHDEGLREESSLVKWASTLDPMQWSVCHYRWLNRVRAPSLLWIFSLAPSDKNSRK